MDALILSCGTGGGHNAEGQAIEEELKKRGHQVVMMDPYELVSNRLASSIGNLYIKIVQRSPELFGFIYMLGNIYRRFPFRSPVYFINKKPAMQLKKYLEEHHVDVIVMPHLYPAEIITYLKSEGVKVPKSVFIATDYTCIPFTEETNCDVCVISHSSLKKEFMYRGIPKEKIVTYGIPVKESFTKAMDKNEAKKALGLDEDKSYYLLAGGSIGAGNIEKIATIISRYIGDNHKKRLIVICGNNIKQYKKLVKTLDDNVIVKGRTVRMAEYMRASDIYITKPGGLSSTEAAVVGIPTIHIAPIPGCETRNSRFFSKLGMSIAVKNHNSRVVDAICKIENSDALRHMLHCQNKIINKHAREDICDMLEKII